MDELISILDKMVNFFELSEDDEKDIIVTLVNIYKDPEFRHSYAELSKYCQKIMPDQRDMLVDMLDMVLDVLDKKTDKKSKQAKKGIGKLADHLELEGLRLTRMEAIELLSDGIIYLQEETRRLIDKNKNESVKITKSITKTQKDIANMNLQVISVLGVFSAIVVAFFGGFSYFTSIFDNLNVLSIAKAAFFTALIGLVIFNIIVILLLALSRLLERPLFSFKIEDWNKECGRFTFVYIFISAVLLLIMILAIIVHCIGYTPLSDVDTNTSSSISVDVNLQK